MSAFGVVLRYLTMACRKTLVYHAVAVVEGIFFFYPHNGTRATNMKLGDPLSLSET